MDSWNAKSGKRKGATEVISYKEIYTVLSSLQTSDEVRAIIWSWRRLIAYVAHGRKAKKLADYEKLVVTEILGGTDLHRLDAKAQEKFSNEFRVQLRAVFLKDALAKNTADGESIKYIQRGLNAHGGSRKGRTFEMYRALLLGIGWDDAGTKLAYSRSLLQGVQGKSMIPGLEAGPSERAYLAKLGKKEKDQIHSDLDCRKPVASQ